MRLNKQSLLTIALGSILTLGSTLAYATNGYFSHGYGTANKALAGAGVALPQDAMIAATNPAGMVHVGDRLDIGMAIFSPHRDYNATQGFGIPDGVNCFSDLGQPCPFTIGGGSGGQSKDSENTLFEVPALAWNMMIDEDSSFGIAVFGNGGMNSRYRGGEAQWGLPVEVAPGIFDFQTITTDGTFGDGTAGVDLSQLFIAPTYSRKLGNNSSYGVSAIFAVQNFEARGLGVFAGFSTDPEHISDNGHDQSYGAGLKLGWQGGVTKDLTLAASAQSKIYMSEFDEYSGLFANEGDFDIPATITIGLAYDVSPTSTFVFDIQHIFYSGVDAIANPFSNMTSGDPFDPNTCFGALLGTGLPSEQCLGGSDGVGFGWDDMTIYKFGYQWASSNETTWRFGYSYGEQPIGESEVLFNILAPGVIEHHLTGGVSMKMGKDSQLNFAGMYGFNESVRGVNPLAYDPVNEVGQDIEISMWQWELEASWSMKF